MSRYSTHYEFLWAGGARNVVTVLVLDCVQPAIIHFDWAILIDFLAVFCLQTILSYEMGRAFG